MNYSNGVGIYELTGGTSHAGPGVAAVVLSVNPKLTLVQLKTLLLQSVTKLPTLRGKVSSEGMVNAYQAGLAAEAAK